MSTNSLSTELLSISGVNDDGLLAALVGDVITLAPSQTFAAPTVTLTRKPASSVAAVASNAITVDLPGWYTATVSAGGFTRTVTVGCWPAAATAIVIDARTMPARTLTRSHLLGVMHDPRCTTTTLASALEGASAKYDNTVVGGGNAGFAFTNYL